MKLLAKLIFLTLIMIFGSSAAWGNVTVTRDQYGIPSISADTEEELFEEFGYITAVDRLWQMEVNKHNLFGKVAEIWDNNIGTYIQIIELRPDGAVGYSRWPLGQSGYISPGADNKPVFDPHFFDMLPHYQNYTYQKMGMD